jgi:6,7-dimethyl-8-ribityllumazine synthase
LKIYEVDAMVHEGRLDAKGFRFAIVVSRFNSFVTDRLLEGALDALKRHGADDGRIEIFRVPGAFEIPLAARLLAKREDVDGVICLGAVIKGGTPHFHYVASEVTKGIAASSLESEKPIAFGILTTESVEQAVERAGTKGGNKGYDAAMSVIEMVNLLKDSGLCGEGRPEN